MFILLSRCAGETAQAYGIRFGAALRDFQDTHKTIKEEPIADGAMLTALGGDKLYVSYRGL